MNTYNIGYEDRMADAKQNEAEEAADRFEAELQQYVEDNPREVAELLDDETLANEIIERGGLCQPGVETKVYFQCYDWADEDSDVRINQEESDHMITIGTGTIYKPHMIEKDVFKLMRQGHRLEQANLAVAQCYTALEEAKEALSRLTCIEHIE